MAGRNSLMTKPAHPPDFDLEVLRVLGRAGDARPYWNVIVTPGLAWADV